MRTAVYARVSTTRQAQAQTIEQQLDRLRAAVKEIWSGSSPAPAAARTMMARMAWYTAR